MPRYTDLERAALARKARESEELEQRARKGITVEESGAIVCSGRDAVMWYRVLALRSALSLELHGIKVRRGFSAYAMAKREYGLKGSRASVYKQFCALHGLPEEINGRGDE